jgi:iron complex transport system permease protein
MRSLIGPDHRWLIPGSALLGAIMLIGSDTIARTVLAPAEMPIGVVTAGFGTPFFLFMLLRQRRKALWS